MGEIQQVKLFLSLNLNVSSEMQAQFKFMISEALGVEAATIWISSFGYVNSYFGTAILIPIFRNLHGSRGHFSLLDSNFGSRLKLTQTKKKCYNFI
jgi:hypothetical protein